MIQLLRRTQPSGRGGEIEVKNIDMLERVLIGLNSGTTIEIRNFLGQKLVMKFYMQ